MSVNNKNAGESLDQRSQGFIERMGEKSEMNRNEWVTGHGALRRTQVSVLLEMREGEEKGRRTRGIAATSGIVITNMK